MEFFSVISSIVPAAIAYTMPLLMGALGGLYSERSGVTNLCIEGLMLTGCFASATTIYLLQSAGMGYNAAIVVGILAAIAAGGLLSMLHAFAAINLKSNQVISGTAINMLATALTLFLAQTITGSGNVTVLRGIIRSDIPLLSKIPVIGPLFFCRTYWTTWICLVVWGVSFFLLYRTSFGLRLRACGEHPSAGERAQDALHRSADVGTAVRTWRRLHPGHIRRRVQLHQRNKRTGIPRDRRADLRTVETAWNTCIHVLLRHLHDDSQHGSRHSALPEHPDRLSRTFPICGDTRRAGRLQPPQRRSSGFRRAFLTWI